jgi:hypothetical protein
MSVEYFILGKISRKKIESDTDIRIVKSPKNDEFLKDKYGNLLYIKPQMLIGVDGASDYEDRENIYELTRYGGNNALYIIDTLVREFNMAYYSDDGFENLCRQWYDTDIISNVKRDMMRTHGYKFINTNWIMIPKRGENDYKKETD